MTQAVICIAATTAEAERIVEGLKNANFTTDDISLLMPDRFGAEELGYEKHSKAPEGMTTGLSTGAILGGALGYLAGIGALSIPGLGPLIAAGPLVAAMGGLMVGGALGGVSGGLIGLGIPEYEAKKYERKIRSGSTLIAVHVETAKEAKLAEDVFRLVGGTDIHRTGEESLKKKSA